MKFKNSSLANQHMWYQGHKWKCQFAQFCQKTVMIISAPDSGLKLSKLTKWQLFSLKMVLGQKLSFWVKIAVILSICSALQKFTQQWLLSQPDSGLKIWVNGLCQFYWKIGPMCPEFVSTATWVVFLSFCWWNIQNYFPPFFPFQIKWSLENNCQKVTFRVGI